MKSRRSRFKKHPKINKITMIFIFFALICIFIVSKFLFSDDQWSKSSQLSIAISKNDGSATVAVFDPKRGTIVTMDIPAETEIKVARQLGTWKIGSVWKLGENEKINGLVAESIMKSFKFPVVAWSEEEALGFTNGKFSSTMMAVFSFYKTNISLKDKIEIAVFSLGVKNTDRIKIDLVEKGYLVKSRLTGGENGLKVQNKIPGSVASIFSDQEISDKQIKIQIVDATGTLEEAEDLSSLIEVLGAKVFSVNSVEPEDFDCIVMGPEAKIVTKIAKIISCESVISKAGNFDLEIKIGKYFAKRF